MSDQPGLTAAEVVGHGGIHREYVPRNLIRNPEDGPDRTSWCGLCGHDWPCPPAYIAAVKEQARLRAELRQVQAERDQAGRAAAALRAALEQIAAEDIGIYTMVTPDGDEGPCIGCQERWRIADMALRAAPPAEG